MKKLHLKNSVEADLSVFIQGQRLTNANGAIDPATAGFDYVTRTTTYIRSRVIRQKFYTIPIAVYIPMDVGEAAWKDEIKQNIVYDKASSFFEGDIDSAVGNGNIAEVNTMLAPKTMPVVTWAKGCSWSVPEVAMASANSNWDPIEGKMKALKKNWDLGVQEVAFLGHPIYTAMTGLLNNSEVTINTSLITKSLKSMTETEFTAFLRDLMSTYFSNADDTQLPDTFVIPTSDYLGLAVPYSSTHPFNSKLSYMLDAFKNTTRNANFKILPCSYCEAARNNLLRGINKNRYVLYKKDPETMSMTIPVDFNMHQAQTADSIFWKQPAIGQYSGLLINRVPEVIYFDY